MSGKKPIEIKIALEVLAGLDQTRDDYQDVQKLLPLVAIKRGKAGLEVSAELLAELAAQGLSALENAIAELDNTAKEAAKPTYESVVAKLRAAVPPEPEKQEPPSLKGVTDLPTIKKLVKAGADVKELHYQPLNEAAGNGALDIVKFIVKECGSPVTMTAFKIAARNGHLAVVKYLSPFAETFSISSAVTEAAAQGHIDILDHLMSLHNVKTQSFITIRAYNNALEYAAQSGQLEVIKILHQKDPAIYTGLAQRRAIAGGHLSCAKYFLDQETFSNPDNFEAAIRSGKLEMVKLLIRYNPSAVTETSTIVPPISTAAIQGDIPILEYLIKKGADINDPRSSMRPLAWACKYNNFKAVKYLIEQGADIHAKDNLALRKAAEVGSLPIIKYLAERGANIHAQDNEAYYIAAARGHIEVVEYLLKNGVDVNCDFNGPRPPLQTAAFGGHFKMVKLLVEQGADIHANDEAALIDAIKSKNLPIVQYLVEHGADIYAQDSSAVSKALGSRSDAYPIAKFLVERSLEDKNYKKFIPKTKFLSHAARQNDVETIQRLFKEGIDFSGGLEEAVRAAENSRSFEAIECLIEQGAEETWLDENIRLNLIRIRLWDKKFPNVEKSRTLSLLNPYHFREEAFHAALSMLQAEGNRNSANEKYAYNISALFQTEERVLQYLERWGDGQRKQPLHDITYMIGIPQKGRPNLVAWGDAVLKHGPKMAKLVKFADKVPEPEQSTLNAGQDKNTTHKTWSYTKTYEKVAQFAYKNGDQHPELAKLCFSFMKKEETFNRALEVVKRYQETYAANDNHKPGARIPDLKIDGRRFNKPGYELYKLPDGDVRGLLLGEFTDCCQSVGGAGSKCAKHGYLSENAGFYVVEDKKKKQIVAQSWAWRGKDGGLVLDSLESLKGHFNKAQWQPLVETLADEFKKQADITGFYIGEGGATPTLPYETAKKPEKPVDYDGYRDSREQYCVFKR